MKLIKLTKGQFAKVDDDDFEKLSKNRWTAELLRSGKFYALKGIHVNKRATTIRMHRLIINAKKGDMVDHINGDTLDNRKENLRFCNDVQNARNRGISKRNKYGHVGIRKKIHKTISPTYQAYISIDGKQKNLGSFKDKEKAILAYVQSAKEIFGDFYRDNND